MNKLSVPELKVVRFVNEDVIATSSFAVLQNDGSYNIYQGYMTSYDDTNKGWSVNLGDFVRNVAAEDFGSYSTDLAQSKLYGVYGDVGNYFTKGATYIELNNNQGSIGGGGSGAVGGDNGLDD